MRAAIATACTVVAVGLAATSPSFATERLVADISSKTIAITSSFAGAELLLFGASQGPGDVVVRVRGPAQTMVVRRKSRVAAVWINRDSVLLKDVPSYYAIASSAPLADILPEEERRRLGLASEFLEFAAATPIAAAELTTYREALVRNKKRVGLYREAEGGVRFLESILFRTMVIFPANAPIGAYQVDVYLVRDGRIISSESTPLYISKSGIERAVFDFANDTPFLYGIVAVLMALVAGWLASLVARRP